MAKRNVSFSIVDEHALHFERADFAYSTRNPESTADIVKSNCRSNNRKICFDAHWKRFLVMMKLLGEWRQGKFFSLIDLTNQKEWEHFFLHSSISDELNRLSDRDFWLSLKVFNSAPPIVSRFFKSWTRCLTIEYHISFFFFDTIRFYRCESWGRCITEGTST